MILLFLHYSIFKTMLVNKIMKKKTIFAQRQSQVTCLCNLHYHLQQKHIQVTKLNYKKKWNLHKNSQAVKKGAAHVKNDSMKKLWNPRWQPRSGCDGRIMAKLQKIQANLFASKFAWIAIILPSQPLLGCHLGSHNLFMLSFFTWAPPFFYSLAVFV